MNPWNLTDKEQLALNLLVEHGSQKIVALEMGLTPPRLSEVLGHAKQQSGERTNMLMVLAWDRMHRKS